MLALFIMVSIMHQFGILKVTHQVAASIWPAYVWTVCVTANIVAHKCSICSSISDRGTGRI